MLVRTTRAAGYTAAVTVPSCTAHPAAKAVARCQRCNVALCEDCFRLLADAKPCCEVCALELASGPPSRWPFAVAFAAMTLAICVVGAHAEGDDPTLELWLPSGFIALVIAAVIGLTSPKPDAKPKPVISERELEFAPGEGLLVRAKNPYRARIARAARRVVPLSGRATALVITAAFVVSGAVLPIGLRLPHWVELELVLGVWWLGIAGLSSVLLFKGWRLAEDHRFRVRRPGFGAKNAGAQKSQRSWEPLSGCADFSGCGEALGIVLVLAAAAIAAWLVVEIVLPVLVFAVYYFVVKGLARVARDRHGCETRLGRSLFWGVAWATLYLAPLAAVVWFVHVVVVRSR